MIDFIFSVYGILLLIAVGIVAWTFLRYPKRQVAKYSRKVPTENFSFVTAPKDHDFNRADLSLHGQSRQWQAAMKLLGKRIQNAGVEKVYFTHGTFVGGDPWGILEAASILYPRLSRPLATKINQVVKKQTSALFKDTGNFTDDYVNLFASATTSGNNCKLFNWSSGNHHAARLKAAIDLLFILEKDLDSCRSGSPTFLLQGHSHAGQVFAILAHLLEQKKFAHQLIDFVENSGQLQDRVYRAAKRLSAVTLDFVTLGAPIVYTWPKASRFRILHLINHRGPTHQAGRLRNFLTTKDGDYIQQLGILGSDIASAAPQERQLNRQLDQIIGRGQDLKFWKESIQNKMRIPPSGQTILVDYQDQSVLVPNFFQTLFGHGVYTRYELMLFNTNLIADCLYSE